MSEKYAFLVTLRQQSDSCCQSKAEVRIFDLKTTWSEFQRASQTATERGEAELRILNFKTTWSEFQKPCQTTAAPLIFTSHVSLKQLFALAHLGCICEAGTF